MENQEFFHGSHYGNQFTTEKRPSDAKSSDHFIIEDLLDFPNDDDDHHMVTADDTFDTTTTTVTGSGISTDSSTVTVVDTSCNSDSAEPHFAGDVRGGCSHSLAGGQFSSELCVPYDDLAELEWLSNFEEESFSNEDLQKLHLISGMKARTGEASAVHQFQPEANRATSTPIFRPELLVPAKARSKRSRVAPCNWTSRVVASHDTTTTVTTLTMSSSSENEIAGKKTVKAIIKKKESPNNTGAANNGEGRKCLHCAADKTPQWRTGPMGPKTLCNACGVRYKSGRLVPEYRPAASPTFVLTKHSNSHRKVLEIRRQKEMLRAQQQQPELLHQGMMFDVSKGEDYLIHQHFGPHIQQLI